MYKYENINKKSKFFAQIRQWHMYKYENIIKKLQFSADCKNYLFLDTKGTQNRLLKEN